MADNLDLPSDYRRMLEGIFSQYVPDYSVWAFGSRIKGRAHPASDLDLVLKHDHNPEAICKNLGAVRSAIEGSNIPILVDVHDWANLPPHFRSEISNNHVLLFLGK